MEESIFLRRWGRKEVKGMLSFTYGVLNHFEISFCLLSCVLFCAGPQMTGSYERACPCLDMGVWCEWPSFSAHFMSHLCYCVVRQFGGGDRLCCGLDSGRFLTVISRFGPFVPFRCLMWDLNFFLILIKMPCGKVKWNYPLCSLLAFFRILEFFGACLY